MARVDRVGRSSSTARARMVSSLGPHKYGLSGRYPGHGWLGIAATPVSFRYRQVVALDAALESLA